MIQKQCRKPMAVVAAMVFAWSAAALDHAQNVPTSPLQPPPARAHAAQSSRDQLPADDFQGLNLTPEQKAEIDKIHRETESHKAVVAKDDKLNQDQKNAMLVGYTRMEYGAIFKVLTPEQQNQVRHRQAARRAQDHSEPKAAPAFSK